MKIVYSNVDGKFDALSPEMPLNTYTGIVPAFPERDIYIFNLPLFIGL